MVITTKAKLAISFLDRMFGLLLKSNPRALVFRTRFGIHTFFLREPIDAIILDHQMKVVKIKKNLKPNKLFFWNPKYFWVLELQQNKIRTAKISLGDKLGFN